MFIEESYEVVEAIEQNNTANLKEELGDLLLQVVFLSQLAAEEKRFTFDDVVHSVAKKSTAVTLMYLVLTKLIMNKKLYLVGMQ